MISRRNIICGAVSGAALFGASPNSAIAAKNALSLYANERFAAYLKLQNEKRCIDDEINRLNTDCVSHTEQKYIPKIIRYIDLEARYDGLYKEKNAIWEEVDAIKDLTGNADLMGARILMRLDSNHDLDQFGSTELEDYEPLLIAILRAMESQMTGILRQWAGFLLAMLEGSK